MARFEVFFTGRVQGVGFRYSAKLVSRRFEVSGTVQNLADGRVKLICEGSTTEIEAFLQDIAQSTQGSIVDTQINKSPATGEFAGFEIVR